MYPKVSQRHFVDMVSSNPGVAAHSRCTLAGRIRHHDHEKRLLIRRFKAELTYSAALL